MNLLKSGLPMRKTGYRQGIELTEYSAFQSSFSAKFITRSRRPSAKLATPYDSIPEAVGSAPLTYTGRCRSSATTFR